MKLILYSLSLVVALTACENQAEKDRKAKAEYAAYTADLCEHAKGNIKLVQNSRAIMNAPQGDTGLEGFAKTVCREAAKAARDANP